MYELTQDEFAKLLREWGKYWGVKARQENLIVFPLVWFANVLGIRIIALFVAPRRAERRPDRDGQDRGPT
jgi:hypothetical protein